MTSTMVRVNTLTYTTTYVAANILRGIKQLVQGCGLDPSHISNQYGTLQRGITTWLDSGHLRAVTLEVYNSRTDALVGRFDFTIDLSYGSGDDGTFWLDTDQVAFVIAKAGLRAAACEYRIVCDNADGRPAVEGWSTTSYRSTAGFTRHAVGTGIGAGSIGVGLSYYSRGS
jgi:hypothetical protein